MGSYVSRTYNYYRGSSIKEQPHLYGNKQTPDLSTKAELKRDPVIDKEIAALVRLWKGDGLQPSEVKTLEEKWRKIPKLYEKAFTYGSSSQEKEEYILGIESLLNNEEIGSQWVLPSSVAGPLQQMVRDMRALSPYYELEPMKAAQNKLRATLDRLFWQELKLVVPEFINDVILSLTIF